MATSAASAISLTVAASKPRSNGQLRCHSGDPPLCPFLLVLAKPCHADNDNQTQSRIKPGGRERSAAGAEGGLRRVLRTRWARRCPRYRSRCRPLWCCSWAPPWARSAVPPWSMASAPPGSPCTWVSARVAPWPRGAHPSTPSTRCRLRWPRWHSPSPGVSPAADHRPSPDRCARLTTSGGGRSSFYIDHAAEIRMRRGVTVDMMVGYGCLR